MHTYVCTYLFVGHNFSMYVTIPKLNDNLFLMLIDVCNPDDDTLCVSQHIAFTFMIIIYVIGKYIMYVYVDGSCIHFTYVRN